MVCGEGALSLDNQGFLQDVDNDGSLPRPLDLEGGYKKLCRVLAQQPALCSRDGRTR